MTVPETARLFALLRRREDEIALLRLIVVALTDPPAPVVVGEDGEGLQEWLREHEST